ncbi:MAG: periplasmic sensor signal transduction histidine kinase [Candidatus Sulfotelmatobacter sp.]|nr:periplasmic sensor signal transduction histidine kinase [Candidatus Sulfotelmatobacter sp.]
MSALISDLYSISTWTPQDCASLHYYCIVTCLGQPLYARGVARSPSPERSPTLGLLLGLIVTLAAVLAYSAYITWQVAGLRRLQSELIDRDRKDSLQLLRIQNDLNLLAVAMRDMIDNDEPYPLTAWAAQFQRIRTDLDDAVRLEAALAPTTRSVEQSASLSSSLTQFWDAVDRVFALAAEGREKEARSQIQISLQARQAALSTAVARLLVQNSDSEEAAAQRIIRIYDRVQRQVYVFLAATLAAILLTGFSMIRWNRRLFAHMAELSERRSELAQKLIATQESTLRYISRELHDEFGQILTAMGSMLGRAGVHAPEGSALRNDLQEVREIAQDTLERVRSLSQALHPVMLDEAGLETTLDWYIPTIERQTGIAISYEKQGNPFALDGSAAVQIYRVLQEALNNVARHSGAKQAWVRLKFLLAALELEVEDHGVGFNGRPAKHGIGLVAMRERSELMGGQITFSASAEGGTLLRVIVPRENVELRDKDQG